MYPHPSDAVEVPSPDAPSAAPDAAPPAPDTAPQAVVVAPLRFCGTCGTPRPDETFVCTGCAALTSEHARGGLRPLRAVRHALALYFTLLAISLLGAWLLAFIHGGDLLGSVQADFSVALAMSLAITVAYILRRSDLLPALRRPDRGAARWCLVALGIAPLTFGLASGLTYCASEALHTPLIGYAPPMLDAGYGWPVILLVVAVQPAVFEELAFRGVMLSALGRVLRVREAVAVTALLFMILHLAPLGFIHLFVIGVALGLLRVKSGSLYPAMVMHFMHNALVVGSEYALG